MRNPFRRKPRYNLFTQMVDMRARSEYNFSPRDSNAQIIYLGQLIGLGASSATMRGALGDDPSPAAEQLLACVEKREAERG